MPSWLIADIPTGYAAYRAWYDAGLVRDDPKLQFLFTGDNDKMEVFIGPNMHAIYGTCSQQKIVMWYGLPLAKGVWCQTTSFPLRPCCYWCSFLTIIQDCHSS